MAEAWAATRPMTKAWMFRSAQVIFLGMVLVKVYVAVPPAARESTAGVPGRRLLRPGPARPPNQAYHHRHRHQHKGEGKEERGRQKEAGGLEEEGEEEEEKHPQRMLGHHPDITLAMIDHANIPECPAVFHHSSSADDPLRSTALVGAAEVWAKLQLATSRKHCRTKGPCCHGKHIHTYRGGDLGEEMSHVRGAVVVRRPDLTEATDMLAPALGLDFVKTFQSHFTFSRQSLLRPMMEAKAANETSEFPSYPRYPTLLDATSFLDAVRNGDPGAGELLTPYCERAGAETSNRAIGECLRIPTVVSMADVYVNKAGFIWNEDDYVVPISCNSRDKGVQQEAAHAAAGISLNTTPSYEKVFIMTQEWGPNWYHFTVEHLPRITVFLDVLLENEDIRIAVHHHGHDAWHDTGKEYDAHVELLGLLGIKRERVILVREEIHADLAILPTSTVCGDPDTHLVNMLRHNLLKGLYPSTGGAPLSLPRPTIVLVVRNSIRGLQNNDEVREALQSNFLDYDVVEFFGTGSVRSQFATFATASLIVGPHGAGLSNTIVAPLHTAVLEIAPISCPPCFLRLTLKLHHVYARHPGGEWNMECDGWYEPDVDEVVRLSRDLLEARREADTADLPAFRDAELP